jgi:hypothetical protein
LEDEIAAERKCLESLDKQIETIEQEKFNHYVRLGHLFIQVKEQLGHSELGPWLKLHCPTIDERTVRNWRRVARNQTKLEEAAKRNEISDLTLTKALKWKRERNKPKPKPKDKDLLEDLAELTRTLMKARTTITRIEKNNGSSVWKQETNKARREKNKLCARVEKAALPLMNLLKTRFPTKHTQTKCQKLQKTLGSLSIFMMCIAAVV